MQKKHTTFLSIAILLLSVIFYVGVEVWNSGDLKRFSITKSVDTSLLELSDAYTYETVYREKEYTQRLEKQLEWLEIYEASSTYDRKELGSLDRVLSSLATTYLNLGENEESLQFTQRLLAKKRTSARILTNHAVTLAVLGEVEKSDAILEEVMLNFPDYSNAQETYIRNRFRQREFEQTYKLSKEVLKKEKLGYLDREYIALMHILSAEFCDCADSEKHKKNIQYKSFKHKWTKGLVDSVIDRKNWEYHVIEGIKQEDNEDEKNGKICEANFYRGAFEEARGNFALAKRYYEQSLRTKVISFVEYNLAKEFLSRLEQAENKQLKLENDNES